MKKGPILIFILVLNSIVLLGQLWPEGAPPFARIVNIITLIFNLIIFIAMFKKNSLFSR
jgi:hypothetical protein